MQLTQEIVARFMGGQIEVQNRGERYLYRGEIEDIDVTDPETDRAILNVWLKWMAKGEGFPPVPTHWVKENRRGYEAILLIYSVADIGDGWISLNSSITGETIVLYPPDGSKLDPSKVEGMGFAPAESLGDDALSIAELGKQCTFRTGHHETRTSITCNASATSAVVDPDASILGWKYRCDEHNGMLDADRRGEVVVAVPRALAASFA